MIKNYLKIIFRNLFREKLYSIINIVGLSMGAAVVILIFLFVKDEWSFDSFHQDGDRIYRAWVKEQYNGEELFNTNTPFILGRELKANFPDIEEVVQYAIVNNLVRKGADMEQTAIHIAMPSFLEVFDFPLLEGNAENALDQPNGMILTKELATRYFGDTSPMGQSLDIQFGNSWQQFQVTGVAADAPGNSSIQFQMILPFELIKQIASERSMNSWTNVFPENYILLKEGVDLATLEKKVAPFIDEQVAQSYEPGEYLVGFQPLLDIHLNNEVPLAYAQVSDWRYPYILGAIALLILLLAAINYVTLAVGRSVSRAKEVGIRKASGATRRQLMQQFWSEAVFVSGLAVGMGILLAELLLPAFNQLLDKSISIQYNLPFLTALLSLTLILGLLAGAYPSFVLSGFSPIRSLRGAITQTGQDKHLLLRGLVGAQFVLSVGLIICTYIMQEQMHFLQEKNLGYNKEQLLTIPFSEQTSNERGFGEVYESGLANAELLRQELSGEQAVLGLTASSHTLGTPGWGQGGFTDPESKKFSWFSVLGADEQFLPLMDIPILSGRNFSRDISADAGTAMLINETMARHYGWEAYLDQPLPPPFEAFRLIGIVEDFHFASLHTEVEPLAIVMNPLTVLRTVSDANFLDNPTPKVTLRLSGENLPATIKKVETAWNRVAEDQPFNFAFVDDALDAQYRSEQRLSKGLSLATILAIFIAGLGLFGISTLTAARRTKEIGVRKVMGASVWDIVLLLNSSITWLVLAASLIAAPIAWYLMKKWLTDFAYPVGMSPVILVIAALLALLIAWAAVSYQSLRAAIQNPVEALKYE